MTPTEDTRYKLGEISGKIDLVLVQMAAQAQANEARFLKLENGQAEQGEQIADLKRDRAWVLGGAATLSTLGAALATWLGFAR